MFRGLRCHTPGADLTERAGEGLQLCREVHGLFRRGAPPPGSRGRTRLNPETAGWTAGGAEASAAVPAAEGPLAPVPVPAEGGRFAVAAGAAGVDGGCIMQCQQQQVGG